MDGRGGWVDGEILEMSSRRVVARGSRIGQDRLSSFSIFFNGPSVFWRVLFLSLSE